MKIIILLFLLISSYLAGAQTLSPKRQIQLIAGKNFHGTGDMRGISFQIDYEEYFRKRISWIIGLGATIHDGSIPLFLDDPGNSPIDGSVRYTTAGFQIGSQLGYTLIQINKHEFQIRMGALVRYQSSSYYDEVSIYYPAGTGLPDPVIVFSNKTPQRTISLGGNAQIQYSYTLSNNISLGVLAGLQTDTNGDTLSQISLTVSKRF